jgi:hypothetical protein
MTVMTILTSSLIQTSNQLLNLIFIIKEVRRDPNPFGLLGDNHARRNKCRTTLPGSSQATRVSADRNSSF